jgi:hypothetical protein
MLLTVPSSWRNGGNALGLELWFKHVVFLPHFALRIAITADDECVNSTAQTIYSVGTNILRILAQFLKESNCLLYPYLLTWFMPVSKVVGLHPLSDNLRTSLFHSPLVAPITTRLDVSTGSSLLDANILSSFDIVMHITTKQLPVCPKGLLWQNHSLACNYIIVPTSLISLDDSSEHNDSNMINLVKSLKDQQKHSRVLLASTKFTFMASLCSIIFETR